jgi:hypothetical protein
MPGDEEIPPYRKWANGAGIRVREDGAMLVERSLVPGKWLPVRYVHELRGFGADLLFLDDPDVLDRIFATDASGFSAVFK